MLLAALHQIFKIFSCIIDNNDVHWSQERKNFRFCFKIENVSRIEIFDFTIIVRFRFYPQNLIENSIFAQYYSKFTLVLKFTGCTMNMDVFSILICSMH